MCGGGRGGDISSRSATRDGDYRPRPAKGHSPNSVSIFDIKSTGHFNIYL